MMTETNVLDVPEIGHYSSQEIEGGVIIRYLVRKPGEQEWTPVKIFRPALSTNQLPVITMPDDFADNNHLRVEAYPVNREVLDSSDVNERHGQHVHGVLPFVVVWFVRRQLA